ncbi:RNA polymerase sigma-70 factor (ECF subfamily) [Streptomyces sp. Ag82_O1-15]|nr:RNA polymerase sigma-70 factor (ECF subfamily) [Streptomyces sp. Ag82_O1-15]
MRWRRQHRHASPSGALAPSVSSAADGPPLSPEEQAVYDDFFREVFPSLMRHVIFLGASSEEAADAVQDALTDVLQHWRNVERPKAWCRIAAIHYYLRSDARLNDGVRKAQQDFRQRRSDDARSLGSEYEEWDFVIDFVDRHLKGAQRLVMALHIDGYEPQEIARELNKDPQTVRSHLRHARNKLAAALESEHPELALSSRGTHRGGM